MTLISFTRANVHLQGCFIPSRDVYPGKTKRLVINYDRRWEKEHFVSSHLVTDRCVDIFPRINGYVVP